MYRLFIMILCVAVLAMGCNKNKQDVADGSDGVGTMPTPDKTEMASGDLRDILLALKRIHFAFDSSELTEEAREALAEAAVRLMVNDVRLYVDGHSDARGTTEYNMSLGERRARKVVDYLHRAGVEKVRLTIVSFGEEKPLEEGLSDEAHALNRRVDFRMMRGTIEFVLETGVPVTDEGQPIEVETATSETTPAS